MFIFVESPHYLTSFQFAMWNNDLLGHSITFAIGMKTSQYFKIPPQNVFFALIWGTVIGEESP